MRAGDRSNIGCLALNLKRLCAILLGIVSQGELTGLE
jgi:hypothetical protein